MEENEAFISKKTVLKSSGAIVAGAAVAGFIWGKPGFDPEFFSIALLVLGFAADIMIRSKIIATFCSKFPEWEKECMDLKGGRKLKFHLSAPQETKLWAYIQRDEQAEQMEREYVFFSKISLAWRTIPTVIIILVIFFIGIVAIFK